MYTNTLRRLVVQAAAIMVEVEKSEFDPRGVLKLSVTVRYLLR